MDEDKKQAVLAATRSQLESFGQRCSAVMNEISPESDPLTAIAAIQASMIGYTVARLDYGATKEEAEEIALALMRGLAEESLQVHQQEEREARARRIGDVEQLIAGAQQMCQAFPTGSVQRAKYEIRVQRYQAVLKDLREGQPLSDALEALRAARDE